MTRTYEPGDLVRMKAGAFYNERTKTYYWMPGSIGRLVKWHSYDKHWNIRFDVTGNVEGSTRESMNRESGLGSDAHTTTNHFTWVGRGGGPDDPFKEIGNET